MRISGPLSRNLVPGEEYFVAFTCEQVKDSLQGRAEWLADFAEHFGQQLIRIESIDVGSSGARTGTSSRAALKWRCAVACSSNAMRASLL